MQRAYKYRLYPTKEQKSLIDRTFGCCRLVWNNALDASIKAYREDKKAFRYKEAASAMKDSKGTLTFLKEVDSIALQQSLRHLDTAYGNFFRDRDVGFPGFKSRKKSRASYTTLNQGGTVAVRDGSIRLPKVGAVRAVIHRPLPADGRITSATVSMERDGTYYCSVLCEYDTVPPASCIPAPDGVLGLDYRSDGLYADSDGNVADMPHYYRLAEKRLSRAERRLSKKQKGSKNREKAKLLLARAGRHVACQRKDFLDKESRRLADRYDVICIEDLDMRSMSRSLRLGKSTLDNGWGMFTRMLGYKLADRGGMLVRVDRFFPSSQLCQCGYQNPITKDLNIRTVTCPECGRTYDRDINAALNIKEEGCRILLSEHSIAM